MAELDPAVRLAMTLRAQPGSYALLLASGVSRSAGVPTGYEVLLSLIGQIAAAEGAVVPGAQEDWYRDRFGEAPTYDGVLDQLTLSPLERRGLLRGFFEPTSEEADQGLKGPTPAHHAVARLVAAGFVSIILETNFDRLTEAALDAAGVPYVVASTPEGIDALKPLHLQRCVVVKLHGDYLDPSMLNTAVELSSYDPPVDSLLDRVFDEYGLVVAGWSADWDTALRHALQRVTTRRFGTYWVNPGSLSTEATELTRLREAVIVLATADQFFTRLADTADSLASTERADPVSVAASVALAKRALAGQASRISLHDALKRTLEQVRSSPIVTRTHFSFTSGEAYQRDVEQAEADTEPAAALVATCTYWGDETTDGWWLPAVAALAEPPTGAGGSTALIWLTRYPATLLVFTGGVAAIAAGRWQVMAALDAMQVRDETRGRPVPLVGAVAPERLLGGFSPTAGIEAVEQPCTHVRERLWPVFAEHLLLSRDEYDGAADAFDYLTAASLEDREFMAAGLAPEDRPESLSRWVPHLRTDGAWPSAIPRASRAVSEGLNLQGTGYGPIAAGLFGGDPERLRAAQAVLDGRLREVLAQNFFSRLRR